MSGLTAELKKLGFFCAIELEVYAQDTGSYTMLIIGSDTKVVDEPYRYTFTNKHFTPTILTR